MAVTAGELYNFIQGSNITGESSFDIWKSLNLEGTELEFLTSIRGKSAYEIWLEQEGNEGKTEQEFLDSLGGSKVITPTDEEILSMFNEVGLLTHIIAEDGSTYIDNDGKILIF